MRTGLPWPQKSAADPDVLNRSEPHSLSHGLLLSRLQSRQESVALDGAESGGCIPALAGLECAIAALSHIAAYISIVVEERIQKPHRSAQGFVQLRDQPGIQRGYRAGATNGGLRSVHQHFIPTLWISIAGNIRHAASRKLVGYLAVLIV